MRSIELRGSGRELAIEEDHQAANESGAVVWDAALVLIAYLSQTASLVADKRVIELGAGTGAVGCTAAALGAASVTLTDLPHLLPLEQQNIEANGLASTAAAAELAWGSKAAADQLLPPFDVVLASDVLYQAEALPLFVQTLAALSGPNTLTLLCHEDRPLLPFPAALFEAAGFEVACVPLSKHHPEWRSDDIHLFHIRRASDNTRARQSKA